MDAEEQGVIAAGSVGRYPSILIGCASTKIDSAMPLSRKRIKWACGTRFSTSMVVVVLESTGENRKKLPPAAPARGMAFFTIIFFVKTGVRRGRETGKDTGCLGRKPKHNNAQCFGSIVCQRQNCP